MDSSKPRKSGMALFWRLVLFGYWITLVVGTHLPSSHPILRQHVGDKVAHFVAYGVLGWLLAMVWQTSTGRLNGRHLRLLWLAILVIGMIDEVTQPPFGRDASIWDWLADAAGAAIGLYAFTLSRSWFEKFSFDRFKS